MLKYLFFLSITFFGSLGFCDEFNPNTYCSEFEKDLLEYLDLCIFIAETAMIEHEEENNMPAYYFHRGAAYQALAIKKDFYIALEKRWYKEKCNQY